MRTRKQRLPLLALVEENPAGEEADFDWRFRSERLRRLATGVRNGVSISSLIRYRMGFGSGLTFHGVPVELGDNEVTCRVIEDIWMRGEYDLGGFIPRQGWRVVDIGGNVGIFSMLAASRGAQVVSYEPHPESFQRMRVNTSKWKVECHNAAVVGAPRTTVELLVHMRHTRNTIVAGLADQCEEFTGDRIEVPAVPIETVMERGCDLLKIDCEGGEYEIVGHAGCALRGARRIIAEIHAEAGDEKVLVEEIETAGFRVRLLAPYPGMPFRLLTAVRR